jgi:hypothetical protein
MSFEALAWCNDLLDADPEDGVDLSASAANVLRIICEDAWKDREHESLIKAETLERRTRLKWDAIAAALKKLEAMGLVFVSRRRASDGTRRPNTYVVLMNEKARTHASALGWSGDACSEKRTGGEVGGPIHSDISGVDQSVKTPLATPDLPENQSVNIGVAPYIPLNDSLTPPVTGARGAREEGQELSRTSRAEDRTNAADAQRLERWTAFAKIWPWRPNELQGEVRAVFLSLPVEDQRQALDGAPRYWAEAHANGVRNPWQARRWLLGEGWKSLKARSVESAAALGGARFKVMFGTAQFWRWLEYHHAVGDVALKWRDRRDGSLSSEGRENAIRMPLLFDLRGGKGFWRDTEWPPPTTARQGPKAAE